MSWGALDPEFRALAERPGVLTARQLDVLKLRSTAGRDGQPLGFQRIAQILGLSKATVREHYKLAVLRIQQEVAAMRGVHT